MIFRVNPQSGVPLYLQLVEQLRGLIEAGGLRPGDALPGIRKVAEELVLNPNTVAKAYREMEHAGLIQLRHGAGAFVAGQASTMASPAIAEGRTVMERAIGKLRTLGLDDGEIRRLLEAELAATQQEATTK